jgi:hypothetical protein
MAFKWLDALRPMFSDAASGNDRPLRQIMKFGIGVCPGCRRLRGVASPRCQACGSAAAVTEDA